MKDGYLPLTAGDRRRRSSRSSSSVAARARGGGLEALRPGAPYRRRQRRLMATASIGVRERMAAASKRIARVKLVDRAATGVITLGGVVIIAGVLGILVFIVAEALPLFRGATAERLGDASRSPAPGDDGARRSRWRSASTSTGATSTT